MSKTGVSKHNTWINVVIDIAEGEAEQLIDYRVHLRPGQESRSGLHLCNWGII